MKHFVCNGCGNLVAMVNDSGVRIHCCSKKMDEVTPKVTDDAKEKHKPHVELKGSEVRITVGPADNRHPMTPEHGVAWICLVTTEGSHRKILPPDGESEARFKLTPGEKIIKAFAYCNLHGLWVYECKDLK